MNRIEKIRLVKELEKNGVFKIKGGINHITSLMGISKYTIYNYLKIIQTEEDIQRI